MVRGGRGYSYGGQRDHMGSNRGSYRGSNSNYYSSRTGSSRNSGNYSSNSHGNYRSSQYDYDSRSSRDKHSERDHKKHFSSSRVQSPDRKRSRHDNSRLDSSYSSSSYHRRLDNSSRNSRQTPPPPSLSSVSKVTSSYRSTSSRRNDSTQRRSNLSSRRSNDSMGPPKNLAPRSRIISRPRGALTRLRGTSRPSTRLSGNSRIAPHSRRGGNDMHIIRKRMLIASHKDRIRRIKIAKLTSSLRNRHDVYKSSHESSKPTSRRSRTDKDKSEDDDKSRSHSKSLSKDSKKKSKTKTIKLDDEKEDTKDDEKYTTKEEKSEDIEKRNIENVDHNESFTKNNETAADKEIEKQEKKTKENDEIKSSIKKSDHRTRSRSNSPRGRRSYIKLTCVQCRMKCLTFQDYNNHLYLRVHKVAMRRLALRQKAQLSSMRLKQRNAQREIEETSKEDLESCKPQFCMLCRLNYRIPKEKHQLSEQHRNMKKFLMPYCNICHLSFQSPMMYENHRCSLDHIKRKARTSKKSHSESSNEERLVDLANFTTVDSVGEVDYQNDNEENVENDDDKEKILVGTEYVKKLEAFYCELCRIYFPVKDDEEIAIKKHCSIRSHLKSFLQHKEDQYLQVEAERVQRKENKEKKSNDEIAQSEEKESETGEAQPEGEDEDVMNDDKLWQDVDKDLGDLLREVGPKEDEEDESVLNLDTERFDKFKNTEKSEINGNDDKEAEENDTEEQDKDQEDEIMTSSKEIITNNGEASTLEVK